MIIKGDFVDGSAVIYRLYRNSLIKGLLLEDGTQKWIINGTMHDFHCGLALVDYKSHVYYINRLGKKIIFGEFDVATDFSEGIAAVIKNDKTILIDTLGNQIREFTSMILIAPFHNGLAKAAEVQSYGDIIESGYMDTSGNFVIPKMEETKINDAYDLLNSDEDNYSNGLIRFKQNGKFGFIDTDINIRIPFIYRYASAFNNGIAAASLWDLVGFIDKNNKTVLSFQYESAANFSGGIAPVKKNGMWGAIDIKGNVVIDFAYEYLKMIEDDLILFKTKGRYGIMKNTMQIIVPPNYDKILKYRDGICRFIFNGNEGVIDRKGNELISFPFTAKNLSLN